MKAEIRGRFLYFTDYTDHELAVVRKLLTWSDDSYEDKSDTPDTILMEDGSDVYTFWGIHDILTQKIPSLTVDNIPVYNPVSTSLDPDILRGVTLYEYQHNAALKAIILRRGLIEIPTAGGKTEVVLAIFRHLHSIDKTKRSIVVVPSVSLSKQFRTRAILRGFSEDEVGVINGEHHDYDKPITFCVINSLNEGLKRGNSEIHRMITTADHVIIDEGHHCRAATFINICLLAAKADMLIALSGSPFQDNSVLDNSGDALVRGIVGNHIFRISARYLIDNGFISEPSIYIEESTTKCLTYPGNYNKIYNTFIVNNAYRNGRVIQFLKLFKSINMPALALVQRHDHAVVLLKELADEKAIVMFGGGVSVQYINGDIQEVKIDYDVFNDNFKRGVWDTIIASPVFDEGIDIPNIGALVLAGAGKSRIKLLQRIGRSLRLKSDGINKVYIVDFDDKTHIYLNSQFKKRRGIYDEVEYRYTTDLSKYYAEIQDHLNKQSMIEEK